MFRLLLSKIAFFCLINVVWTVMDCSQNCYEKYYVVHYQSTDWFEAHILCQKAGMEMATIESKQEQQLLEEVLIEERRLYSRLRKGIGNGYWVSGTRRNSGGLVWFVNGRDLSYRKFPPGQPDFAGGIEACIEVFYDLERSRGFLWNDYNCKSKIGYICQSYNENLDCDLNF